MSYSSKKEAETASICRDPHEEAPLDVEEHSARVAALQARVVAALPRTTFPPHYSNVAAAMPGYNQGNFTTGWC